MITEIIQFADELSLLEAHLEQHRPWGWRTIIAESDRTIMGMPKELVFEANKERFERFDVEYVQIPGDLFTPAAGYREMRDNDWKKRYWLFENVDPKNPWMMCADVDEILAHEPVDFEDVDYVNFALDQRMAQVNRRVRHGHNAYRLHRSSLTMTEMANAKTVRRKVGATGWHFTNCPSSAQEMVIKAQCRHWYFGVDRPEDAPGVEYFEPLMGKAMDYVTGEMLDTSQVITTRDLPPWMQENLHLFPVADGACPDDELSARCKKNVESFG